MKPLTEKQQFAFPFLPKDNKIYGAYRKERRNLDLQPYGVVEEPDIKVEEETEEDTDFYLPIRN